MSVVKRAPMGFMGMRGKKEFDLNNEQNGFPYGINQVCVYVAIKIHIKRMAVNVDRIFKCI